MTTTANSGGGEKRDPRLSDPDVELTKVNDDGTGEYRNTRTDETFTATLRAEDADELPDEDEPEESAQP